ncbi:glycosyltransferase family 4 protein [Mucilaginibacter lacusdianchii]|uniref:glycosyltransferase family 4 protein n=1 Tax=Mucilaginibacter lacusdianchii TaxID=2684211 RepID=UPI0018EF1A5A|nr:glycosyltransferase family 1 protein [Mucilaginibacter sp. JXJ CY 39]
MHIVVDARMIDASGIGTYLQNVLTGISALYQITLLGDPNKLSAFKAFKIIPFTDPIYSIKEQWKLKKIVPECDVFWSPHYNVPLFKIKAKKRLVTIHDVYHLAFSKQLSLAQRLYAKIVINAATKLSNAIVTVSEFSKSEIIKYTNVSQNKIRVIYNGVHSLTAGNVDISTLYNKYRIPEKYILFVGNVKPHKNLKALLAAYLKLNDFFKSSFKIVIVGKKEGFITGDPKLFEWIESQDELVNKLVFTGYVANEDMDSIYQQASVFVFPSLYEGFGLPPLEAMANKCPVIVSNGNCLPEVCGDAALYFAPENDGEISDTITTVLGNNAVRQQLIEKGEKHIKHFTWERSVHMHKQVFDILADSYNN